MGKIHRLPEKKPEPISEEQEEREYQEAQRTENAEAHPPGKRTRRQKLKTKTFARIPHDLAWELYRHGVSSAGWVIMVELDRLILKEGGKNPVRLSNVRLRELGASAGTPNTGNSSCWRRPAPPKF